MKLTEVHFVLVTPILTFCTYLIFNGLQKKKKILLFEYCQLIDNYALIEKIS